MTDSTEAKALTQEELAAHTKECSKTLSDKVMECIKSLPEDLDDLTVINIILSSLTDVVISSCVNLQQSRGNPSEFLIEHLLADFNAKFMLGNIGFVQQLVSLMMQNQMQDEKGLRTRRH